MTALAILFASIATLGAFVGLEYVGHPIGGQSITAYGWGLCLNAAAIAAFLAYRSLQRA
ncbi:hypothetical protein MKK88_10055 [Methylobacterium sp. E-005]|jgi:hypothetical protein|uniref:Uncharacterized protein n=1 Tax=Methylobacterium phyllostachyos TaxID=582672 RepID=A0A1H0JPH8_9HYPH|nr:MULTISPECIES: hypothetical protein [Methylobacterium]MCJ2086334.1 hypothetical protein [Methylobacterium sp. E-005]SDO45474.1 hypothetical protein SAMN05216360_12338 [Methylobacterium phyllostachyos]